MFWRMRQRGALSESVPRILIDVSKKCQQAKTYKTTLTTLERKRKKNPERPTTPVTNSLTHMNTHPRLTLSHIDAKREEALCAGQT